MNVVCVPYTTSSHALNHYATEPFSKQDAQALYITVPDDYKESDSMWASKVYHSFNIEKYVVRSVTGNISIKK